MSSCLVESALYHIICLCCIIILSQQLYRRLIPNLKIFFIHAIKTSSKDTLTPEMLSKMWNIGLPTAAITLTAKTHKDIRSTGLLSRRFKTDQYQLGYKQFSRHYGTFYVDFLKNSVKSIHGFMGGTIYFN